MVTASNDALGNGSAIMSPTTKRTGRRTSFFSLGKRNHPLRHIQPHDIGAARRQRERDVPGAGGQIENPQIAPRLSQIDQAPFPSAVLTVGQRDGNEIIAVGNRRKERTHVPALAVRGGDFVGQGHEGLKLDNIVSCSLRALLRTT